MEGQDQDIEQKKKAIRIIIGQNLKRLREEKDKTQAEIAKIVNMGNTTVSNWEKGISSIDITLLMKLCEELSIPLDEFYKGLTEHKEPSEREKYLINQFRKLNNEEQIKIISRIETIIEIQKGE